MEWHDGRNEDRTNWGSWRHYRPVFSDSKHKCEYVTLWIEVGSIRPLPDYEVIWTVPIETLKDRGLTARCADPASATGQGQAAN